MPEDKNIWEPFAVVIAFLASLILWLKWLATQTYTIETTINTAIIWLIIVAILVLGSQMIGYLSSILKQHL